MEIGGLIFCSVSPKSLFNSFSLIFLVSKPFSKLGADSNRE